MCQLTYFYFFWTRFTKNSPKLRAWFTWIQALGEVHVIVSNEATTLENVGQFGKFSKTGDFFNVQTKSLDMHSASPAIRMAKKHSAFSSLINAAMRRSKCSSPSAAKILNRSAYPDMTRLLSNFVQIED